MICSEAGRTGYIYDGKTYYTQWFDRARMELHTELPEGHQVVLGTLGSGLASTQGK